MKQDLKFAFIEVIPGIENYHSVFYSFCTKSVIFIYLSMLKPFLQLKSYMPGFTNIPQYAGDGMRL